MEEQNTIQQGYSTFHSEEVQEIMGRKPAWILRWGITVIFSIIAGILVGCYLIKYPETVAAEITLTSDCPPSDLAAKVSGTLDTICVKSGDFVRQGQLLASIASAARFDDIALVERMLAEDGFQWDEVEKDRALESLRLGDLQSDWVEYLRVRSDYADYLKIDQVGRKKDLLFSQVQSAKEYYSKLERQREMIKEELAYQRKDLERDSLLFKKNVVAEAEYESSLKNYISKKNDLAGFDASMTSARLSRLQLEQQILELETQQTVEVAEYERRLAQAKESLLGQIALWKERYAIIAPVPGLVSLQNVWGRGQWVNSGDIIASVATDGGMKVKGRLKVPSSGFGKVAVGQTVNIKLNGFPYLEFGILKGVVVSISPVPEDTAAGLAYTVDVDLPKGLESTYHKEFPFVQNMDGNAEIITEDMRLIEQFVRPIRSLFLNK
ncbi:MAG: HlyD family efflux transporter periplasmic adaptor subunit [Bacteroidales bacterium]|nr:HlyD family efflux transporter periplasmic adaptor subunit [Bacteroidales bacterium]